MNQVNFSE